MNRTTKFILLSLPLFLISCSNGKIEYKDNNWRCVLEEVNNLTDEKIIIYTSAKGDTIGGNAIKEIYKNIKEVENYKKFESKDVFLKNTSNNKVRNFTIKETKDNNLITYLIRKLKPGEVVLLGCSLDLDGSGNLIH
jgi:hypothetical protein